MGTHRPSLSLFSFLQYLCSSLSRTLILILSPLKEVPTIPPSGRPARSLTRRVRCCRGTCPNPNHPNHPNHTHHPHHPHHCRRPSTTFTPTRLALSHSCTFFTYLFLPSLSPRSLSRVVPVCACVRLSLFHPPTTLLLLLLLPLPLLHYYYYN